MTNQSSQTISLYRGKTIFIKYKQFIHPVSSTYSSLDQGCSRINRVFQMPFPLLFSTSLWGFKDTYSLQRVLGLPCVCVIAAGWGGVQEIAWVDVWKFVTQTIVHSQTYTVAWTPFWITLALREQHDSLLTAGRCSVTTIHLQNREMEDEEQRLELH